MRAEPKGEQSIDLIGKNEVYGDTSHEGKLVLFFYLYLVFTGIWGFKPRDHYVSPVHVEVTQPRMHRNKTKGDGDGNTFVPQCCWKH